MSGITSLQGPSRVLFAGLLSIFIVLLAIGPAVGRFESGGPSGLQGTTSSAAGHLVVSELVTGGAGASDEFIELYNPTADALPLEGLEMIYVSASGATITRKASWPAAGPMVPPGAHWLVANSAGVYAPLADTLYANGLAATGGSVALRIQGASTAVDALGWGNAVSGWLEGAPAPAPPAGSSLERLPGGLAGSAQDTDDNLVDFGILSTPDPQNAAAGPLPSPTPQPTPSGAESTIPTPSVAETPSPLPTASSSPSGPDPATPSPSPTPVESPSDSPAPVATPTASLASLSPSSMPSLTPSASPNPIPIGDARALPDGSTATISGTALTSSDFTDGGGCISDSTGAIAVLMSAGSFARGDLLTVAGTVDDRYAQRTLRSSAGGLAIIGSGIDPSAVFTQTGGIGETTECRLVLVSGEIGGTPTSLASGLAFDIDDGSGAGRVLVAPASGIDTTAWVQGANVSLVGLAGQRDSSGTGVAGYRVMPRDAADILSVLPPATPSPTVTVSPSPPPATPTASRSPSPRASTTPASSPTPTPGSSLPPLIDIRRARAAATGAVVRVRGVVTVGNGIVDGPTAVIQDASGAIVLRLGDKAGRLRRATLIEALGVRSTKAGMATIRVERASVVIGPRAEPTAQHVATGAAGETLEARLIVVRAGVTSAPVRSATGNVALTLDDGSGPLRVTIFSASRIPTQGLVRGAFVALRGVLGQQTTGAQPRRGYRLWPRGASDLALVSAAGAGGTSSGSGSESGGTATADSAISGPSRANQGGTSPPGAASTPRLGMTRLADGASVASGRAGLGVPASPGSNAAGSTSGRSSAAPRPTALLFAGSVPSRYMAALLLASLGVLVLLGTLAWRTGALGRLRLAVERALGSGGGAEPNVLLDPATSVEDVAPVDRWGAGR